MKKSILCLTSVLALGSLLPSFAEEAKPSAAIAVIRPTQGNKAQGTVRFTWTGDQVKMVADVSGLTPGSEHGFHIHQYGDASAPDASSAGGHFNPDGHPHGAPHADAHHVGDFGNLKADAQGKAHLELTLKKAALFGEHGLLGRSVIVHAKKDDLKSQPTGDAGDRIGMGVIGVAKPAK